MFLQPPGEPYLIPHPFFSSHFIYQDGVQAPPYSQAQIYVSDSFYHVFPYHPFPPCYFQRPANPSINPRELLPRPRRNTRIKPTSRAATTSSVQKWVPKRKLELTSASIRTRSTVPVGSSLIPFPTSPHQQITSTTTTNDQEYPKSFWDQFYVRFISQDSAYFSATFDSESTMRTDLVEMLKAHCLNENLSFVLRSESTYKSEFDFLYLPMDFKEFWENRRISNLGYAFVNFTSFDTALRFYKQYHKFEWPAPKNRKICVIACAKTQGKEALIKRFKNMVFWCHSNDYLPVLAPPCDGVVNSDLVPVGKVAGKPKIREKKKNRR